MKRIILITIFFICSVVYCYPYPAEDVYSLAGNDYFPEVKKLIGSAKSSIYISMYIATYYPDYPKSLPNQLLQELVNAQQRGVEVKVILEQGRVSSPKGEYNDMAYFFLKDKGIAVDYDTPATKLHDKLIIIDEYITIIGSHNWSANALKENHEVSVVIKSQELAKRFIHEIQSIQLSSRRTPPPESKVPTIYIPYQFLTNPKLGEKMVERTMRFYLYLLRKWEESGRTVIILDYLDAARFIDWGHLPRFRYRNLINENLLKLLQNKYKLISAKTKMGGPAEVILLDYRNPKKPFNPDPRDCFLVPGGFWEFDWVKRLSRNAKYFYFISLAEANLTLDPKGWWSQSQKHLRKKYQVARWTQSPGIEELNRYNLLAVQYGPLIYPFKRYAIPAKFKLLPLYSWEWHEQEIEKLKELYGANKVEIAQRWASVVLEENNLEVIEKLINYFNQYGGALVQFAVDKVAEKRIVNPKRNFGYIEAIILQEGREMQ